MTPERRAKNKASAQMLLLCITIMELQQSLGIAQGDMEEELGIDLTNLAELENPEEIQVYTLIRYIKALGGSLKLVANFPDKEEEIILAQYD